MKDETANSSAILREAVQAIRERYPNESLGTIVGNALRQYARLSEASATELGRRIEKIAFPGTPGLSHLRKEDVLAALVEVNAIASVDFAYDIPALAGYAQHSPLKVYIDRGLARERTLRSGRIIDIVPYLVLHEVVEKSLLDAFKFNERGYQRTHQIAQRLEQEAVRADGISWKEYQYDIMVPEIDRAYVKRALKLPPDLDVTPYRDLDDMQILEPSPDAFFTVSELGPEIYHLQFDSGTRMAGTMMRFQEYYESPKFRGTYFTREEFNAWYAEEKGGASYIQTWGTEGFNVPSEALQPFFEGRFAPLSRDEADVLRHFEGRAGRKFYIIATAKDSPKDHLDHEIAHATYFLNSAYRRAVDDVLAGINIEPIRHFLRTDPEYSSYHEAVLQDEVHAYLAHTSEELEEHGIDLAPYKSAIARLQELYRRYAPPRG
ncbi:MAG TPA: hypothetical protein VHD37_03160 [Candidatus Paceibacterota bacterium]|nr:hypothetical protein [Candidatus Paceibacterota bacterium]